MGEPVASRLFGVVGDIIIAPSSFNAALISNVDVDGATHVLLEIPTMGGRGWKPVVVSAPSGVVIPLVGGVLILPKNVPRLLTAANVLLLSLGLLLPVAV